MKNGRKKKTERYGGVEDENCRKKNSIFRIYKTRRFALNTHNVYVCECLCALICTTSLMRTNETKYRPENCINSNCYCSIYYIQTLKLIVYNALNFKFITTTTTTQLVIL